jgi:putative iron-only hydrogenase system regulator
MKNRVAVLGVIIENPEESQAEFNSVVAEYKGLVRGRMGVPFENEGISVVSIIVAGPLDDINSLTGKIGNIKGISVKTSLSKKEI